MGPLQGTGGTDGEGRAMGMGQNGWGSGTSLYISFHTVLTLRTVAMSHTPKINN